MDTASGAGAKPVPSQPESVFLSEPRIYDRRERKPDCHRDGDRIKRTTEEPRGQGRVAKSIKPPPGSLRRPLNKSVHDPVCSRLVSAPHCCSFCLWRPHAASSLFTFCTARLSQDCVWAGPPQDLLLGTHDL
uniref:Uncharacterized protein n=1 Tax=Knipowitschia caucasica TaxID=637954 RepID=A0AAV2LT16_KNICA